MLLVEGRDPVEGVGQRIVRRAVVVATARDFRTAVTRPALWVVHAVVPKLPNVHQTQASVGLPSQAIENLVGEVGVDNRCQGLLIILVARLLVIHRHGVVETILHHRIRAIRIVDLLEGAGIIDANHWVCIVAADWNVVNVREGHVD